MSAVSERSRDLGLLLLRVGFGATMALQHGRGKLEKLSEIVVSFPDPLGVGHETSAYLAVSAEVGASLLILIGFCTRLAAIPAAFTMGVALFVIHAGDPFAKRELSLLVPCCVPCDRARGAWSLLDRSHDRRAFRCLARQQALRSSPEFHKKLGSDLRCPMNKLGRREMLSRSLVIGGAAIVGGSLASACSSGLSCSDTTGLSAADLTMRTTNRYVDQTPNAAKRCDGCNFYQARAANTCGGCTLIKGPINPAGTCQLWVGKVAT